MVKEWKRSLSDREDWQKRILTEAFADACSDYSPPESDDDSVAVDDDVETIPTVAPAVTAEASTDGSVTVTADVST
ncbi:uncharacterized protein N7479_001650 [Penicillium vulpinum]|nr:uncharacterized protein N7479_001650 [Penicillium vulpinum]KAJ5971732.1 hypothetical protein N7479_001650 [Penicillium vulpinum]